MKKFLIALALTFGLVSQLAAADRTLAIAFAPAGSTISIHINANPDQWVTKVDDDLDGYVTFQIDDNLGDSDIKVEAAGYQPYIHYFRFKNPRNNGSEPRPLNQQVNIGADIPALMLAAPPTPSFTPRGIDLVNGAGERTVLVGEDQFRAFRMFLSGEDLTPLFRQANRLGFNFWRVFMQGSAAQNGFLQLSPSEPGYYEHVRPFAELLNRQGILLLAEVYVDNQDIHAGLDHWARMGDELRGTGTILSGGNEWRKNGFDPGALADPGMLWTRGSDLSDSAPFRPYGTFALFHPRRDLPTMLLDAVASPVFLYSQGLNVPFIFDEPIGAADVTIPGKRSADPALWWQLGRAYSTFSAGAVFHNDYGMRGQVMSAQVEACARAFIAGMRLQ